MLVDDEPATDRVVDAPAHDFAVAAIREEYHALAVELHGLQGQNDVGGVAEVDSVCTGDDQLLVGSDPPPEALDDGRFARLRFAPLQPEHDGPEGAVSGPGRPERAVE